MNPPCRAVMALCFTSVVTACGITAQQTPARVPAGQVPYRLLDTAPPTTTPPSGPTPISIYLVGPDGRLTPSHAKFRPPDPPTRSTLSSQPPRTVTSPQDSRQVSSV